MGVWGVGGVKQFWIYSQDKSPFLYPARNGRSIDFGFSILENGIDNLSYNSPPPCSVEEKV
ncbi:hypothetical protein B4U84_07310 [Westiellopsis prolifica IICB1]|nr:hypothetical protein B4U84_07310 [Westiellopsis prolifica IICB1]